MKRITKFIIIFIFLGLLAVETFHIKINMSSEFILEDYTDMINMFPSNATLGQIKNTKDVKTKARKLFQETYFENDLIILYQASYDKGTDTWLVSNNKISIKFGGSAYAIYLLYRFIYGILRLNPMI